jgi:iron complex transport system ATP-binding protein
VEVLQLLRRFAAEEQKTIFLSTHDVELALQLADRLWLMDTDGLSVGTPHELSAQGALSRFIERPGITFDTATLQIRVKTV